MSDPTNPQAWIEIAEQDYALAIGAIRRKRVSIYGACFHAQQCAEKYMKALLVYKGQSFPKTHDLVQLNGLCAQAGVFFGINEKVLNTLSDHAVRVRYPGDDPTLDEAREALETAKTVRRFARKFLNVK